MPTTVVPVADRAELTREAALRTWNLIIDAQGRGDGYARIVLTGGGAGIGTLRDILALHQSALAQSDSFPTPVVDWNRVHVFFGDERNVAVNDPESNEGQAREALLDHVGIPEDNIHGWRFGELSLEDGVTAYIVEHWKDQAALDAHNKTAHFIEGVKKLQDACSTLQIHRVHWQG